MQILAISAGQTDHLALRRTDVATISRPAGVRLTCTSGTVWVTQGNQSRDMVLYPGQVLLLDRRKPVCISALQECTLRVDGPAIEPSAWTRGTAAVASWLQRSVGAAA
jgi:hypothetical protein